MQGAALHIAYAYAAQFMQYRFAVDIRCDGLDTHHIADVLNRFNLGAVDPVSYTHLTLPTNREV